MKKIKILIPKIMIVLIIFLLAGCSNSSEIDRFIGNWENTSDGFDYINIYKDGENTDTGLIEISFGEKGPTYSGTCKIMTGNNSNKIKIQYNDGFIKDKIYTLQYEFDGSDKLVLSDEENTLILERIQNSEDSDVNEKTPELKIEK